MHDEKSVQKTNDEVFEKLKAKSQELRKKHKETTKHLQELNETLDKVLERRTTENHP